MAASPAEAAFWTFVQNRSGRLRLIARTVCGDHGLADDLVQEALERTWLNWRRLDDHDPFAWTRRVMVNLNIDRARRRRWREQPLHDVDPVQPGDATTRVDDQRWLAELLTGLTEKERAVVALRYLEDLSEAQTADELGVALGTVKSTCARALDKLRRQSELTTTHQTPPASTGVSR